MSRQPHILLITSDQHRADSLGYAGHPCVRTPHLDLLAREGTIFDCAYSDAPICIPARTTMVTGIQSHHYGCPDYEPAYRIDRSRDKFLGSLLTKAGYQTTVVGKQHWHTDKTFRGGFENFYSFEHHDRAMRAETGGDRLFHHGIGRNELSPSLSQLPPHLNSSQWVTDRCIEFMKTRDKTQPMFMWASMIEPHPPNVVHEPFYSMYDQSPIPDPIQGDWAAADKAPYRVRHRQNGIGCAHMKPDEIRKARGVYYGMITNIDHQIGRLIGSLRSEGMWEDTIVLYTTDHGELLGDFDSFFKANFLEGAGRIPWMMRCPSWFGEQKGQRSDALVELADLLPTLCDAAGAEIPDDIDGKSLCPILRGESAQVREVLHGQMGTEHMFHDGQHKYIYFVEDGRELLFDLKADPREQHDLAGNEALCGPIRQRFIEHMRNEANEHINDDGELLNQGKVFSDKDLPNTIGWISLTP